LLLPGGPPTVSLSRGISVAATVCTLARRIRRARTSLAAGEPHRSRESAADRGGPALPGCGRASLTKVSSALPALRASPRPHAPPQRRRHELHSGLPRASVHGGSMAQAAANLTIAGEFVLNWRSRWVKRYVRNPFAQPIDFW
jgi:hypothetical protein